MKTRLIASVLAAASVLCCFPCGTVMTTSPRIAAAI